MAGVLRTRVACKEKHTHTERLGEQAGQVRWPSAGQPKCTKCDQQPPKSRREPGPSHAPFSSEGAGPADSDLWNWEAINVFALWLPVCGTLSQQSNETNLPLFWPLSDKISRQLPYAQITFWTILKCELGLRPERGDQRKYPRTTCL